MFILLPAQTQKTGVLTELNEKHGKIKGYSAEGTLAKGW